MLLCVESEEGFGNSRDERRDACRGSREKRELLRRASERCTRRQKQKEKTDSSCPTSTNPKRPCARSYPVFRRRDGLGCKRYLWPRASRDWPVAPPSGTRRAKGDIPSLSERSRHERGSGIRPVSAMIGHVGRPAYHRPQRRRASTRLGLQAIPKEGGGGGRQYQPLRPRGSWAND